MNYRCVCSPYRCRRASTFMETMVALTIVGVAIVALMEFMGGSTKSHGTIQTMLQASDYASAALEYAANQSFTDMVAWETTPKPFSPPVNGQGVAYTSATAANWKQIITSKTVAENALRENATAGSTPALWLTVTIERNGKSVYSENRLYMRPQ